MVFFRSGRVDDDKWRQWARDARDLAVRIKSLITMYNARIEAGTWGVGKAFKFYNAPFMACPICHTLGFKPVGKRLVGMIGFYGGGLCGEDLFINEDGEIVRGFGVEDGKMRAFLEQFNEFEKKVANRLAEE